MKQLSEEEFNNQFAIFWTNLESAGISEHYDMERIKRTMMVSAAGTNEDSGVAYPGALLVHINLVTSIAQRLRTMISGTFSIDEHSLLKVCLLQHLSKSAMFKPNDNDWEINNRGMNYKFAELEGRLKSGERSIMYAMKSGVTFSAIEFEAMVSIDRDDESRGSKSFDSPLSTIIRQANELAFMLERERNKK